MPLGIESARGGQLLRVPEHTSLGAAATAPTRTCRDEAGPRALADEVALKLRQRAVPLNADARRAIAIYLAEERRGPDPGEFLFISQRTKGRLTEKAVRGIAAKYGYHAMVEDAHPHAFRHSFATELLRKGVPLTAVGALLGHESLQSTARYTQPSERDLREAVNKLTLTDEG